jgi:hypothetical protein
VFVVGCGRQDGLQPLGGLWRYRTYSWIRVNAGNDLWKDRITQAVHAELQAKGWQKVPSDGDASVAAFGAGSAIIEKHTGRYAGRGHIRQLP